MRKIIFPVVICLCASFVLAGDNVQPLNIKTGLWETTFTTAMSGRPPIPEEVLAKMPPEQRAKIEAAMKGAFSGAPKTRTSQSCVTKEQLNKDLFSEDRKNCTRTVLKSTGSYMEIREVCENEGVKNEITIQIEALNSENVKGTSHVTSGSGDRSMNVNMSFTSRWLGAVCTEKK